MSIFVDSLSNLKIIRNKHFGIISILVFTCILVTTNGAVCLYLLKLNSCNLQINNLSVTAATISASCGSKLVADHKDMVTSTVIISSLDDAKKLKHLESLLDRGFGDEANLVKLGEMLWQIGERDNAIFVWQQAKNADVYFSYAGAWELGNGHLEQGLEYSRIAQGIDSFPKKEKLSMYSNLCDSLQAAKRLDEALPWCELSAQFQTDGWRQITLATIKNDMGDYEGALAILQDLLERQESLNSPVGLTYHKLGQTYWGLGQVNKAAESFQLAIDSGFATEWVYRGLFQALLRQRQNDQVCQSFLEAQRNGFNPDPELDKRVLQTCSIAEE